MMLKIQANIALQTLESFSSSISYAGLIASAAARYYPIPVLCFVCSCVFCVVLFYGLIAGPAANNFPLPAKEIYVSDYSQENSIIHKTKLNSKEVRLVFFELH